MHFGDDAAARRLARHVNEFGAGVAHANPQHFGHFTVLPLPDVAGSIAEMRYALDELGSEGVTLLSNAEGIYLGAEQLHPLLAELDERRAIVFVHPTSPPCADRVSLGRPHPMIEFIFETTRTVSDLVLSGALARYPDIRWIFSHGAGALPLLADRIELFRRTILGDEREHPSVPEQVSQLWFDSAGTPFPHQIPATVAAFGSQRLLYGSDYCWTAASGVLAQVATIDDAPRIANQTWRELTSANAALLLTRRRPK